MASWYDYPQYFDMMFRDETDAEIAFFQEALQAYGDEGQWHRVIEPGCGGGRLVVALANLGFDVVGYDQNEAMVRYTRRRLRRRGLAAEVYSADMRSHEVTPPADFALCTFNTFRHLVDEGEAEGHLRVMARSLRPGGLYFLGFHCIPLDADPECTERWTATHAGTRVTTTLRVLSSDRRDRRERLRVSVKATLSAGTVRRVRDEFDLRLYTPEQARSLLEGVADLFQIVAVHDFDYNIDESREIDHDLCDALFVLRRRNVPRPQHSL
ncbi:MAG: class I SAM-dependent methyltransferase [Planctomycetota bacterium]